MHSLHALMQSWHFCMQVFIAGPQSSVDLQLSAHFLHASIQSLHFCIQLLHPATWLDIFPPIYCSPYFHHVSVITIFVYLI